MFGFFLFSLCALAFSIGLSVITFIFFKLFGISIHNGQIMSLFMQCLIIGSVSSLFSLLMSRKIARWTMGVELVDMPSNEAEEFLVTEISELAERAGIKMPQVGIFYSEQINAFATGPCSNASLVAVSSALLESMTADEARAVLAHEIAHVRSGDMFWMTVINGISNGIVMFFSYIISSLVVNAIFEKNGFLPTLVKVILETILQMTLGLLSMVFVMAFSRYREFRADEQAAQLVGRRHMIDALLRLNHNHHAEETLPPSLKAFGIFGKAGMFSSHPSLDDRIVALKDKAYA
ncbi:protease HtpX [Pseudomonas luteola]